jgi:hypothetical protein
MHPSVCQSEAQASVLAAAVTPAAVAVVLVASKQASKQAITADQH